MTKSRLQRTIDPILGEGSHLFAFRTDTYTFNHDETYSIVINHGSSGRLKGYESATVEGTVAGRIDGLMSGSITSVYLREGAVDYLADYIGARADLIQDRYYGRTSKVEIDDQGRSATTTFTGTSWFTQLNYSPRHVTPNAAEDLGPLLRRMAFMDSPIRGTDLVTRVAGAYIAHNAAGEQMLFKDAVGDLAEDIGIALHEKRNGITVAWAHKDREDLATANLGHQWPLMRSQAIAPAKYQQMGERPPSPIDYTVINSTGGTAVRSIEPDNPTGETRSRIAIDWSRWRTRAEDNQLWREAWTQAYEVSPNLYSLPEISIDMLYLLRRGTQYAKKIATQILELEAGDPIYLAGDWSPRLRGVLYAEGIKETITPNEWRFDLSLIPHALGAGVPTPTVPSIAWDSFLNAWDTEQRTWNL